MKRRAVLRAIVAAPLLAGCLSADRREPDSPNVPPGVGDSLCDNAEESERTTTEDSPLTCGDSPKSNLRIVNEKSDWAPLRLELFDAASDELLSSSDYDLAPNSTYTIVDVCSISNRYRIRAKSGLFSDSLTWDLSRSCTLAEIRVGKYFGLNVTQIGEG
ncbi:hypothetical protein [Haloprofundus sp. MHR1]|uniref:hypothetical protein n=1 Tax=Haloprofundus sp. MHR1 TaxID=2572921 RepID=UPI0010BE6E38|nr:hypothetical protein [Haloprofundus sp. MHR1]QCJ47056.1 hypothetical protein FCF25_07995 [Haloprofundus sp. MHR1]